MGWICRTFGHRFGPVITGFRAVDGAVIGRCRRCQTPIVAVDTRASVSLRLDLDAIARRSVAELAASGVGFETIARSEILRRTVVYDEDKITLPTRVAAE